MGKYFVRLFLDYLRVEWFSARLDKAIIKQLDPSELLIDVLVGLADLARNDGFECLPVREDASY